MIAYHPKIEQWYSCCYCGPSNHIIEPGQSDSVRRTQNRDGVIDGTYRCWLPEPQNAPQHPTVSIAEFANGIRQNCQRVTDCGGGLAEQCTGTQCIVSSNTDDEMR